MFYVKEWFTSKEENQLKRTIMKCAYDVSPDKETEKAMLLSFHSDYGTVKTWVPKSCIQTQEEYDEDARTYREEYLKRNESYKTLIQWAKDQGVKGIRVGLRVETIKQKIVAAGLVIPA